MIRIWRHIAECLESTGACALVTVAHVDGSAPREAGARMVVRGDGGFFGTIGGGTLELDAIRRTVDAIDRGEPGLDLRSVSLGPDLGQCCGGRVDLAIEVIGAERIEMARSLAEIEASGVPFSTRAAVDGGSVGPRTKGDQVSETPFLITEGGDGRATILHETFGQALRPLYLFGAGHVGKALILGLAQLPFQITWIDSRAEQFPAAVPANVRKCTAESPMEFVMRAPDDAFILAMTHSHALDEEIMASALSQQRFGYCGVIGSETKRARFLRRLRARGIPDAALSRMVCPVGLPQIRSRQPAAIAAGIAADLLLRDERARAAAVAGAAMTARSGKNG